MKRYNIFLTTAGILFSLLITSCSNQEVDFKNYDYSTVYFAYQYPVRTIVLGDDIVDNSMDNAHKCKIYATMGGVYANPKKIDIDIEVNEALCDHLYFKDGTSVQAMPAEYYSLASNVISLAHSFQGGVEVELNDAFFADADAIRNTYVIPLEMTKVVNADSILSGEAKINDASKCNISDWEVAPKDYVLYCVKYINPYHAIYLRRGVDVITQDGASTTLERRADYVENDELCELTTVSLNSVEFPISISNVNDENQNCSLLLTFDDENNCVVSTSTSGFTITGNGKFVNNGEKNSWGDKDRNAIYLDYTIEVAGKTYATLDTLVVRDRGVAAENFSPSYMKE